jgi:hypothetical protein
LSPAPLVALDMRVAPESVVDDDEPSFDAPQLQPVGPIAPAATKTRARLRFVEALPQGHYSSRVVVRPTALCPPNESGGRADSTVGI